MIDHDPKCLSYGYGPGQRMDICICTGIRIGRDDERERVAAGMKAEADDFRRAIQKKDRERLRREAQALRDSLRREAAATWNSDDGDILEARAEGVDLAIDLIDGGE